MNRACWYEPRNAVAVMKRIAVLVILLVSPLSHADDSLAVRAGTSVVSDGGNVSSMFDGAFLEVEGSHRVSPHASVAVFGAYSSMTEHATYTEPYPMAIDWHDQFFDVGIRARAHFAGAFVGLGAGVGADRSVGAIPANAQASESGGFEYSDWSKHMFFEGHAGYTFPRMRRCDCAIEVIAAASWMPDVGASRVLAHGAVGLQF